ncbi:MAG TPA: 3-deoxy-manno-octulosonate cytidylyltransferase [Burkholderiales bacterium]
MKFTVIVPARYASSRFPGKPLVDIEGKPMIVQVCDQAKKSGAAVHVATDDERIAKAVRAAGYSAIMTRADHLSGTDRIAEAAGKLKLKDNDVVVNVQGDEPRISPGLIKRVAGALVKSAEASMSTACHTIHDPRQLDDPNVVKVVLDREGYAIYFSRSRIPYPREAGHPTYRHAGIYAYRVGFLRKYAKLRQSPLERTEALEQLRVLWHGYRIAVAVEKGEAEPSVDTPQDLIQLIKTNK